MSRLILHYQNPALKQTPGFGSKEYQMSKYTIIHFVDEDGNKVKAKGIFIGEIGRGSSIHYCLERPGHEAENLKT